jgi:hypothetical protein
MVLGLAALGSVGNYSPMRRGLKPFVKSLNVTTGVIVGNYSPMRRGLKPWTLVAPADSEMEVLETIPR